MNSSETRVIHVVDNDKAICAALAMLLESHGLNVRTHSSAQSFLDANGAVADTDCLVMDLNMPGMNGVELLERLHELGRWFPVIVITGYPDSVLAGRARQAGVRAILKKPFNDELLIDHIREALHVGPSPYPA